MDASRLLARPGIVYVPHANRFVDEVGDEIGHLERYQAPAVDGSNRPQWVERLVANDGTIIVQRTNVRPPRSLRWAPTPSPDGVFDGAGRFVGSVSSDGRRVAPDGGAPVRLEARWFTARWTALANQVPVASVVKTTRHGHLIGWSWWRLTFDATCSADVRLLLTAALSPLWISFRAD